VLVQPQLRLPPPREQILVSELKLNDEAPPCWNRWPAPLPQEDSYYIDGAEAFLGPGITIRTSCSNNLYRYLTDWSRTANVTLLKARPYGSAHRPRISASLDGTIKVLTSWFNQSDIKSTAERFGRPGELRSALNCRILMFTVNNVTIALPHNGIPTCARDPRNRILQPEVGFLSHI
jgi:hypothetical protein